jgi:hypothetical protein
MKRCADTLETSEIAQLLGRSRTSVKAKAKHMGISLRKWGENHHRCKHSAGAVESARIAHERGKTPRQIAAEEGLPLATVAAWCYFRQRTEDPAQPMKGLWKSKTSALVVTVLYEKDGQVWWEHKQTWNRPQPTKTEIFLEAMEPYPSNDKTLLP